MTLWSFLLAAVGPLAIKIMVALGISVLTVGGVSEIMDALIAHSQESWSSMPTAMLGLVGLSGASTAVGMILGAFNARLALWLATSATRWAVKA